MNQTHRASQNKQAHYATRRNRHRITEQQVNHFRPGVYERGCADNCQRSQYRDSQRADRQPCQCNRRFVSRASFPMRQRDQYRRDHRQHECEQWRRESHGLEGIRGHQTAQEQRQRDSHRAHLYQHRARQFGAPQHNEYPKISAQARYDPDADQHMDRGRMLKHFKKLVHDSVCCAVSSCRLFAVSPESPRISSTSPIRALPACKSINRWATADNSSDRRVA